MLETFPSISTMKKKIRCQPFRYFVVVLGYVDPRLHRDYHTRM